MGNWGVCFPFHKIKQPSLHLSQQVVCLASQRKADIYHLLRLFSRCY